VVGRRQRKWAAARRYVQTALVTTLPVVVVAVELVYAQ
jgi:hypothetical protein